MRTWRERVGMWETVLVLRCATMGPSVHPPLGQSGGGGGGADEVPGCCGRTVRVGEVESTRHRLETDGVVVHVHICEGGSICTFIRHPPGSRLDGVEDL